MRKRLCRLAAWATVFVLANLAVLANAGYIVHAAAHGDLITAVRDSQEAPGDALGQSCTVATTDDRRTIEVASGSIVGGSVTMLVRCTYSSSYGTVMDVDDDDFSAGVTFVERSGTCVYGDDCGDGSNQEAYCTATHSRIDDGTIDGYFEVVLQGITCSGSFPSGGATVDIDRMFISSATIGGNGNNVCSYRTATNGSFGRCHQAAYDSWLAVAPEWHWITPVAGEVNLCESVTPTFAVNGTELATLSGETAEQGDELELTVAVAGWAGEAGDVRIFLRADKLNGDSAPLRTFDFLDLEEGDQQTKSMLVGPGGLELSTVEMSCHFEGKGPVWWGPGDGPFGGTPSGLGRACAGMGWVWPDREQLLSGETVSVRFKLSGQGPTDFLTTLHLDVEGSEGLLNFDAGDSGTYLLEIEEATPPAGGSPIAVSSISYQHHGSGWFTASWTQPDDGLTAEHGIWCSDAEGSILYQFDGTFVGTDTEGQQACFTFESMSLTSPSSWLRGLGGMGVCLLSWAFVPPAGDVDDFVTDLRESLEGTFPLSLFVTAHDSLQAFSTAANASAAQCIVVGGPIAGVNPDCVSMPAMLTVPQRAIVTNVLVAALVLGVVWHGLSIVTER